MSPVTTEQNRTFLVQLLKLEREGKQINFYSSVIADVLTSRESHQCIITYNI